MSEASAAITHLVFLPVEETTVFRAAVIDIMRDSDSFEHYDGSVG